MDQWDQKKGLIRMILILLLIILAIGLFTWIRKDRSYTLMDHQESTAQAMP